MVVPAGSAAATIAQGDTRTARATLCKRLGVVVHGTMLMHGLGRFGLVLVGHGDPRKWKRVNAPDQDLQLYNMVSLSFLSHESQPTTTLWYKFAFNCRSVVFSLPTANLQVKSVFQP